MKYSLVKEGRVWKVGDREMGEVLNEEMSENGKVEPEEEYEI